MNQARNRESLGELFGDLTRELVSLMRHEIKYAKTEMGDKAVHTLKRSTVAVVGATVAYVGFLCLTASAVIALAKLVPLWASALLVGLLAVTGGLGLFAVGFWMLRKEDIVPRKTLQLVKDETEWIREQAS